MGTSNAPSGRRPRGFRRQVDLAWIARNHPGWPLILVALLIVGAIGVFADVAEDVYTADRITLVDMQLANWLHAHGTPLLTRLMLTVSTLHDMAALSIVTVLLAMFLYRYGERDWLLSLVLVIPGGMALNTLLKHAFARARPHFTDPIVTLTTYSFPSGHVAGSTLLYGFVAVWLISHGHALAGQIAVVVGALLMIALVAASRVYLGAHFLSDVVGAFFESTAWLGLCLLGRQIAQARAGTGKERRR